jgi:hypothetical protein
MWEKGVCGLSLHLSLNLAVNLKPLQKIVIKKQQNKWSSHFLSSFNRISNSDFFWQY